MLPNPSVEQAAILNYLRQGFHLVGDCVAGSGKTTTVLHIAKAFPKRQILQITYNAQLKSEVRAKADATQLPNLEVHTYHSLAVRYYSPQAHDDTTLRALVRTDMRPRDTLPRYHILVLDESQDMTLLYYCLVRKFLLDHGKDLQILVLGDRYQGIYQFKDADIRYLTLANTIWGSVEGIQSRTFLPVALTTSYRVTHQIAAFVNTCMLGADRILATHEGPKVKLLRCNTFRVHRQIGEMLLTLLHSGTFQPSDIFVLAGSIKSDTTPIRRLENLLVEAHIPCYYPTSDEGKLDEEVVEGKVVFSTFHQAKGRERAIVVVYGFDNTYFQYFGKDYDPMVCPETLYVATTRAKEHLILLESTAAGPLPFLKQQGPSTSDFLEIHGKGKETSLNLLDFGFKGSAAKPTVPSGPEMHRSTVRDLTRFLNEQSLEQLTAIADQVFSETKDIQYTVEIPSKVQTPTGMEDISDINGIVIPAMYEVRIGEPDTQSTIEIDVRNAYLDLQSTEKHIFLQRACCTLPDEVQTVGEFLQMGLLYNAITERVYNRLQQIKTFDWLSQEAVIACFQSLSHLNSDTIFEQPIEMEVRRFSEYGCVTLTGRMDAITDECVWEFKCVENLTLEHQMQLLTYAWMWRHTHEEEYGAREFRLLNIRTGQVLQLDTKSPLLEETIRIMFDNKWAKRGLLSDTEFLERCHLGIPVTTTVTETKCHCWIEDD